MATKSTGVGGSNSDRSGLISILGGLFLFPKYDGVFSTYQIGKIRQEQTTWKEVIDTWSFSELSFKIDTFSLAVFLVRKAY